MNDQFNTSARSGKKGRGKSKRVRLYDVAKAAGVSTSIASRFLNGQIHLSKEKEQAIQDAVEQLGYSVNTTARALRLGFSEIIGLLVEDTDDPFWRAVFAAVEEVARSKGYLTILSLSDYASSSEYDQLDRLHQNRVDGIILCPSGKNIDYINMMIANGVSIVQIDSQFAEIHASAVVLNNQEPIYQATKMLIERGHTNIGVVMWESPDVVFPPMKERLAGYQRALWEHGLAVDMHHICAVPRIPTASDRTNGQYVKEYIKDWLGAQSHITGLLPFDNILALHALAAARELDLRIPKQLSVIAFDDMEGYELARPRIASFAHSGSELGRLAAQLLFATIQKREEGRHVRMVLPTWHDRGGESIRTISSG